jgi:hypothetical protein
LSKSRLQALLAMGSGAAAEPLAGLAGLYGLVRGGPDEGVRLIDKVRGNLAYQPSDTRGQQEVARALGPLARLLESGRAGLGDAAYGATGSPAAAAAAYTAPDALLSLLGYRPAVVGAERAAAGVGAAARRADQLATTGQRMHPQAGMAAPYGYQGGHLAPQRDFGASLDDLTGGGEFFPDDIYGPNSARIYGHGLPEIDRETARLIQAYRNKPDAMVTIYRAVPNSVDPSAPINPGDWVTINKKYAEMHGQGFDDGYRIIEMKVPARDIYNNADSMHEWGYDPGEPR